MRIGFFGNTNNYPFTLARAIHDAGHEIVFFVDSRYGLHRPENRYPQVPVPYPAWMIDVSPMRLPHYALPNRKRRRVIDTLRDCDAVVLNGLGASMLPEIGRPAFLLISGADLDYFADPESIAHPMVSAERRPAALWKRVGPPLLRWLNGRVVPAQRRGIQMARGYSYFARGLMPAGDRLLHELGVDDGRRRFILMADLDGKGPEPLPDNDPLRLFCAARFNWKHPIPPGMTVLDYKGSDVMIRGLALFRRRHNVPLDIRLVKKGLHVREAMALAEEEGIDDQITWLEEMPQQQVREEFKRADIVLDQFGRSMIGMACLDAMALGRPVIADGRPEFLEPALGAPSAICQARSPEEISDWLARLTDRSERIRAGAASRRFVEEFFSPRHAAQVCLEALTPPEDHP